MCKRICYMRVSKTQIFFTDEFQLNEQQMALSLRISGNIIMTPFFKTAFISSDPLEYTPRI